jgi:hypothetical protein
VPPSRGRVGRQPRRPARRHRVRGVDARARSAQRDAERRGGRRDGHRAGAKSRGDSEQGGYRECARAAGDAESKGFPEYRTSSPKATPRRPPSWSPPTRPQGPYRRQAVQLRTRPGRALGQDPVPDHPQAWARGYSRLPIPVSTRSSGTGPFTYRRRGTPGRRGQRLYRGHRIGYENTSSYYVFFRLDELVDGDEILLEDSAGGSTCTASANRWS